MQDNAGSAAELKFVFDENQADAIRQWMRCELGPDPHGVGTAGDGYQTTTLYFDTEDFDHFFRHGSYARAKFRIRRYNGGSTIFLERKMKVGGRVTKRRSHCTLADLDRISAPRSDWQGAWFARRLEHRKLQPVCEVAYDRTARIGVTDSGPVRLTLDTNLRATRIQTIGFTDTVSVEIAPNVAILEMKYRVHVPPLFKRLIEEFGLASRSHSKYRTAIRGLGLVNDEKGLALGV
jgi:SPX domain protein involved in polyphosphate accumulation